MRKPKSYKWRYGESFPLELSNVSNPMPILYMDSSIGCGFFPSWPRVPTPNVRLDIWDCVESYVIHMILACRLIITFTSKLKLMISFLVSPLILLRSTLQVLASFCLEAAHPSLCILFSRLTWGLNAGTQFHWCRPQRAWWRLESIQFWQVTVHASGTF